MQKHSQKRIWLADWQIGVECIHDAVISGSSCALRSTRIKTWAWWVVGGGWILSGFRNKNNIMSKLFCNLVHLSPRVKHQHSYQHCTVQQQIQTVNNQSRHVNQSPRRSSIQRGLQQWELGQASPVITTHSTRLWLGQNKDPPPAGEMHQGINVTAQIHRYMHRPLQP